MVPLTMLTDETLCPVLQSHSKMGHNAQPKGQGGSVSGGGQTMIGICSLQLPDNTGQAMDAAEL